MASSPNSYPGSRGRRAGGTAIQRRSPPLKAPACRKPRRPTLPPPHLPPNTQAWPKTLRGPPTKPTPTCASRNPEGSPGRAASPVQRRAQRKWRVWRAPARRKAMIGRTTASNNRGDRTARKRLQTTMALAAPSFKASPLSHRVKSNRHKGNAIGARLGSLTRTTQGRRHAACAQRRCRARRRSRTVTSMSPSTSPRRRHHARDRAFRGRPAPRTVHIFSYSFRSCHRSDPSRSDLS